MHMTYNTGLTESKIKDTIMKMLSSYLSQEFSVSFVKKTRNLYQTLILTLFIIIFSP